MSYKSRFDTFPGTCPFPLSSIDRPRSQACLLIINGFLPIDSADLEWLTKSAFLGVRGRRSFRARLHRGSGMQLLSEREHYQTSSFHPDHGDHLHAIAFTGDGRREPTCDFNWDEVEHNLDGETEPESPKVLSWDDATSMLVTVLQWCLRSRSLNECGSRIAALHLWLRPQDSAFVSYSDLARETGVTKACLSNWITTLRDQLGEHMPPASSKRNGCREVYRNAQLAAVKAGTHSSQKEPTPGDRRFRKQPANMRQRLNKPAKRGRPAKKRA
jgi:hypothetical protein